MAHEYESFVQRLSGTQNWIELERHRRKAMLGRYLVMPSIGIGLALLGVCLFLFSIFSFDEDTIFTGLTITYEDTFFGGLGAIIVSVPLSIFLYKLTHKNYSKEYKKLLMPQLISDVIKSYSDVGDASDKTHVKCKYKQSEHIDWKLLLDIPLFQKYKSNRIFPEGEDLFSGYVGSTDFQFSDFTFKKNVIIPLADQDFDLTVFTGLVFIADFHKAFEGTTTLSTRKGKMYLRLTRIGSRMNTVSLEFDHMFKISTTDEITARYLLPINMLERIANLRKLFPGKGMTICLHEGMLVISIHNVDSFESDGLKKLDAGGMKRTYDEIKAVMDIFDLLNLNLRIWNKKAKKRR